MTAFVAINGEETQMMLMKIMYGYAVQVSFRVRATLFCSLLTILLLIITC